MKNAGLGRRIGARALSYLMAPLLWIRSNHVRVGARRSNDCA